MKLTVGALFCKDFQNKQLNSCKLFSDMFPVTLFVSHVEKNADKRIGLLLSYLLGGTALHKTLALETLPETLKNNS